MPIHTPFGKTTWQVDAALIWYGAVSGAISAVAWLFGVLEGWGVTISFLFALAALPLAFLSCILFRYWREIAQLTRTALGGLWRRSIAGPDENAESISIDPMDATDGDAHERIELFILEFVNPACWAQIQLQQTLLERLCGNEQVLHFAKRGLVHDYMHWQFCVAYSKISQLGGSPMPDMTTREMIECIVDLENESYKQFCDQADQLAQAAGLDQRSHADMVPLWEEWRLAHNALVEEFDKLKRESKFGRPLYRPQKPSRWGGLIPPLTGSGGSQSLQ